MNKPEENYCLPTGYTSNPTVSTNDAISGKTYWNPQRVRVASYYQYSVYKEACHLVKDNKFRAVLDVGCGVGKKLEPLHRSFRSLKIYGVDQDQPIEYCKNKYSFGSWFVDDFDSPNLTSWPSVDLVICADVIEHVSDPDKLLETLRQACGESGLLLISTPDRERLYGHNKLEPGQKDHVREWSGKEFKRYLESRNWHVQDQKHSLPVRPLPTVTLARELWKQLKSGGAFSYNQYCIAKPAYISK